MTVTLIGCGCGSLTSEAEKALGEAQLVIGSERLLARYGTEKPQICAVAAPQIMEAVRKADCERICVLFSGDSGFHSGARLMPREAGKADFRVLPGISSLQVLAARLGEPWQDWRLVSAHGTPCDAVSAVCGGRPVFFLTGGEKSPGDLCRELTDAGLGFLKVKVGENLGMEEERITGGTALELEKRKFAPLSVMLSEAAPRRPKRVPGLPDEEFIRTGGIPMTKRTVRASALAMLGVGPEDLCWDIGAGTGSVSVELALQCKMVYGIEKEKEAAALAEENRKKHGAWNLRIVEGSAPDALEGLPAPDAAFVGGSGGRLRDILACILRANPQARICVAAVTLETLQEAEPALRELGCRTEVLLLSAGEGRKAGRYTLMTAQNPVWLIGGRKE